MSFFPIFTEILTDWISSSYLVQVTIATGNHNDSILWYSTLHANSYSLWESPLVSRVRFGNLLRYSQAHSPSLSLGPVLPHTLAVAAARPVFQV